ncbi:siderophore ferric iron reductase [Photobacterium sanctipauli]|uniref:Siderophore ferric iron reductase n=1 Tax=Photobacterium sanctipauli TaxID=1342794 RepID=A0A2T3NU77_9GAMM|nr:siderophore ferric iron reductase [Photobacterium sanctipauli]PSW19846.1 siderophore ferric iron reductase [Photobacterium sanctipauli]
MAIAKYKQLFQYAEQISPSLKGRIGIADHQHISAAHGNPELLNALYQYWKEAHPEAGNPYWLTRSWTMLAWQPVYIAFIGVYAIRSIPPIYDIAQDYKEGLVAGYHLSGENWFSGTEEEMIKYACTQLAMLLDQLQSQFNQYNRLRPGLTKPLIADAILQALVHRQALLNMPSGNQADASTSYDLVYQAKLWLSHLDLPMRHLEGLSQSTETGEWQFKRLSCCMHYRRDDGSLCDNCPRS